MRQEAPRSYRRRRDPRTAESYYQHRAVAAWKFGRDLAAGEVVHHVNGDRRNNHPDNIWIFSSQRAHMLWHHYRWREARGVHHPFSVEELLEVHGEWVRRRGAPQLSELQGPNLDAPLPVLHLLRRRLDLFSAVTPGVESTIQMRHVRIAHILKRPRTQCRAPLTHNAR